ncbi:hypothetical protein NHQ30_005050 [Ciborinia camelliae]|nr:hypothetical protein NHQ30_005050 [Ciborinia camelliae]
MSKESSDQALLQAVFKQADLANIKIDYDRLAQDLGMSGKDPKAAAAKRWSRYRKANGLVSEKPTNKAETKKSDEMNSPSEKPSKKRKMAKTEEDDEEEA